MKKIILIGKKTESDYCLLQNAEMLCNRTLTVFAKYSIADGAIDYYYMVGRRFENRQSGLSILFSK